MADIRERIVIESVDNTTRGMRTAQNKLNAFDRTLKRVQTTLLGFVGINIGIHFIQATARMSDSAVELEAKLRLMTDSTEDFNYAQQELVKLSLESGSSLEANTILFTRMNKAIKSMGGNTQTTLDTTRALSQGLRISGASTQESASVIRQWSQAMASGVLRGEEFNAVSENGARIIQAISESLGVTIGELRAMSKEGQLTAQTVTKALLEQAETIAEENAKLPLTIGRAIEKVNTQYLLFLQDMKSGNSFVAESLNKIAIHFDGIVDTLSALVRLGGIYVAIGLAKALTQEAQAFRQKIINQKASAEASRVEVLRQEQLNQGKIQAELAEKRLAVVKTKAHVLATQQHIVELQDTVQRITLTEKENLNKIKSIKEQVALEAKINNSRRISVRNRELLILAENRARLSATALREAKMGLAGAEQTLTTAITAQNRAIGLNTIALQKNGRVLPLLGRSLSRIGKIVSGLGNALLGIPGLIGYIGFEIASQFVPAEIIIANFVKRWSQLIEKASYYFDVITSFGGTAEMRAEHAEAMDAIEEKYNSVIDTVIEGENKQRAEFKDTGNQRVANATAVTEQLKALEDELLEGVQDKISRNLELGRIALSQKITNESQYQLAVSQLEAEAEELRVQAIIESSNRQLGQIQEFYDSKIELQNIASQALIDNEKELEDLSTEARAEDFNDRHEQFRTFRELQIANKKSHNAKLLSLSHEQAKALKEVSQQTLDALIADSVRLANKQREAVNRGISVIKEASDFIKSINGDQRSSYQQLADAQKVQRQIETDLRKASKAELKGDHEEAQRLREKALNNSKDLTNSYKDIAESSKDGSISQVQANGKIQQALDLVKKSADGVKKSTDEIGESAGKDLAVRKNQIEQYQQIISELDKQINKTRIVEVDVDAQQAHNQIDVLDQKIKALSQDVVVTVKSKKGGTTGDNAVQRASGGFIPRTDRVPGTGSGDKVKALLEPGEFIMRKSAVQKFGESAMYAMNRGVDPVRRAVGGMINGVQRFATGGKVSGDSQPIKNEYLKLLEEWIKRSQKPGRGFDHLIKNQKASGVVTTIQGILDSIDNAEGKDSSVLNRLYELNKLIYRSAKSSATVFAGKGFEAYLRTAKDASYRARNVKIRDNLLKFNLGGMVSKFAEGGSVQGSGLGDTVKALLTPGEFVMNKGVVQQFGFDFMNSINKGVLPQKFANGGLVGAGSNGVETINVNFNVNGNQATGTFSKNDATMQFIDQLKSSEASS